MARTKFTSDYIPTAADFAAVKAKQEEYQQTHVDPRHEYEVSYEINNTKYTEKVFAIDSKTAANMVKQQCGMVGWIPRNLNVTALENTNIDVA